MTTAAISPYSSSDQPRWPPVPARGISELPKLYPKSKKKTMPSASAEGVGAYGTANSTYGSAFSYFPNRALKNVSLGPNSLIQQYCQDPNGRLQIVGIRLGPAGGGTTTNCGNGGDALNLAFSYGSAGYNNGNLTSETLLPLNVAQSFTYDAYNRLSQAAEGTAWSQTYKYDVTGNPNVSLGNRYVSASSGLGILPSSFTPTQNTNFDSNNRLIIQGSTYYNAGNLKTVGGYNFTYDAENREVSNTVNSAANSYYYDGEGRRVEKVTPSTTTVYVYDAKGEVAAEYATYPPGPPATLYPTADPLGSTRLTSNAAGTAMGYHDYLPFGEEIPSTVGGRGSLYGAPELTQKFTGKERDTETASSAMEGLDYFGARYFSGSMGRFTSSDPVHFLPQRLFDPQQWNTYSYVRNNPLGLVDLSGLYTVNCPSGDSKCTNAAASFESARLKDLKSKKQAVRDAAAAWGSPTDKNGIIVAFKDQATMNSTYGNGPGNVNGAVTAGQTQGHQPDIDAVFSENLRGGDLQRTIAHEGAHIEDDMAFLRSFDPGSGTFNAGLNISHYDTEFHAFEVGAQVKSYLNLSCGGAPCSVVAGPKGYQALDLYLTTTPRYVRSNDSLVFPVTEFPQRPPMAAQQ